ncbi:MAG TPA: hypothetical protein VIC03_01055 [Gemmatimonadaceae bacterium]|jgi:hypothetical protein
MPSDAMHLHVTQERSGEGTRRTLHLEGLHDPQRRAISAFFDMVGEFDLRPPELLDGFMFGIIMYAMRLGQNIRVHGTLSRQAIRNCYELQDAWALWNPGMYHKIHIEPDASVSVAQTSGEEEAIAAYSGGVDSTFTLLRHAAGRLGLASYPLKRTVLLVHGFDVPLAKPEDLEALRQRFAPLLDELGLEARILRTNLKELDLQRWQDSFMTQLACCLHNYSHEFGYGLVASSKAYDSLLLPVGSSPATDHLLSGATLSIVHDGAGYSRTEKVEEIARNATATRVTKVCWEGSETYRNCGVCDKCVRTLLNFRAVGVSNPACFEGQRDLQQLIANVGMTSYSMCMELESIIAYAHTHAVTDPWVAALERRVARYEIEMAEVNNGRLRNAWGMARRGEWRRLAAKLRDKFPRGRLTMPARPSFTERSRTVVEKIAQAPLE